MDSEEKDDQVARYRRGQAKCKSLEERKLLEQSSKQRKSTRKTRGRQHQDWGDYDDEDPFETFEVIERVAKDGHAQVTGTAILNVPHPWLVMGTGPRMVTVTKGGPLREAHVGGSALPQGRPVVGDHALLEELAGGEARLRSIAERKSVLERKDPGQAHRSKVLAANVDVALLVATAGPKGLRQRLLDRLRVAVENGNILPVVVLSKLDLLEGDMLKLVLRQLQELRADGISSLATSSLKGAGIAELRELLQGRISVVVGPSGAGKSALLNSLDPDNERGTGAVRSSDSRGRHTTTAASMHAFGEDGGWLIDTPGIREFGVVNLDPVALLESFPLLAELAVGCQRGCTHQDDPSCALALAATDDERLDREYRSFLRLLDDV
ncbi:MAG: ribosome biogenesis GTPase [Planctomycetota bacterium]